MGKLIIFNWKMNPTSLKEARQIFDATKNSKLKTEDLELIICPPFVYLPEIVGLIYKTKIKLGAQDVFWENPPTGGGVYTGEISAKMLKNLGVEYVIIGHSERRKYLGETDEMINKKVLAALRAGLKVVLCVGEPTRAHARELRIKNAELRKAKNYVKNQLEKDLKNSKFLILNSKLRNHLVIAYEPIWAIGAKYPDTPQDAVEMIRFIKKFLISHFSFLISPKVLYGGSVNGKNIKNFIQLKEIDGVLVGGASVKKDEVRNIIRVLNYER
ncbi:MAG: triose-phosphate isomerase [Patescibacteria group bacterium]